MHQDENARTTVFRAMLAEHPLPAPEESEQAKSVVSRDPAFQAACDALLRVVLNEQPAPLDHPLEAEIWRRRLQVYIAAQLAGHAAGAEFADIRHVLDTDVALSEEYALLYETMSAEAQNLLAQPATIPTPRLDFLPTPTPIAAKPRWRQPWGMLRQLGWAMPRAGLYPWRRLAQVAMLMGLLIVLGTGLWRVVAPLRPQPLEQAHYAPETKPADRSPYAWQIALETPLPNDGFIFIPLESGEPATDCRDLRHDNLLRKQCPL